MANFGPVYVFGAGRVASALVRSLPPVGIPISAVIARRYERAARLAHLGPTVAATFEELTAIVEADSICFFAVSDDSIADVAQRVADAGVVPALAVHTSGIQAASVFERAFGSAVPALAFHPVRSFKGSADDVLEGAIVTLQGSEEALSIGKDIVSHLQASAIEVSIPQKEAIHAASALLANMTVALAQAFDVIVTRGGLPASSAEVIRRRLLESVEANLAEGPPGQALTGPLMRGDVSTVKRHLEVLKRVDHRLFEAYRNLGGFALDLVRENGEISPERLNELERALN